MKNSVKNFISLVKFEHTLFALPFALIGFFLAVKIGTNQLSVSLLIKVLACMVFARNAAMGFNRYLDRTFDAANPRTQRREIPVGVISPKRALIFVIVNSIIFIIICRFINDLCFYLSPVALAVILGYSYTKKYTALCHFILSTGLSLAPIGAYLAVTGKFAVEPLLISAIVFFWVSGFDIIYACQDIQFDREYRLKSIPVLFEVKRALQFSAFVHFITILFVIIAGITIGTGLIYWIGAAIFIGLLIFQHLIVKPGDLSRVNLSFFTTNGIASIIYAVFVIASLYLD